MGKNYILKKLFSGTILRVLFLIVSIMVAFYMMPFLVHTLGDTQYGLWVLVGTLTGYYGFLDFGLAAATQRYIAKHLGQQDFEKMNVVISSSLIIYAILGAVILAVSVIGSIIIYYTVNPETASMLAITAAILGASFAVQFPARTFGGVLRSYIRQDIIIGVEIAAFAFRTILIIYFVKQGHGLITLAVISFLSIALSSAAEIIASYSVFKALELSRSFIKKDVIKSLFSYSWVAFIANITEILKFKLSPIIVAAVISVEAVVIYAIAFRLLEYFSQLFGNLIRMVTPVFSQLDGRQATDKLELAFIYTMMASIIMTLFVGSNIIFFGYNFIYLWMGEEYISSYTILWILGIAVTVWIMQAPGKELLFGTSNHKYYAMLSTFGLVTTSIFSIIGGLTYGLYGLAVGLSIGVLIPEMMFPFVMRHVFGFGFREVYLKTLFPVFLKTLLILCAIFGTMLIVEVKLDTYFHIFMYAAISTFNFAVCSVVILPTEIRNAIKDKIYEKVIPRLYFYRRHPNV